MATDGTGATNTAGAVGTTAGGASGRVLASAGVGVTVAAAGAALLLRLRERRVSEAAAAIGPMAMSFMGESRRLDNTRLKRELRLKLRYPTVAAGLPRG